MTVWAVGWIAYMMRGMKMEGFNRLRRMLVRGSNKAYDTKNIDKQALYCPVVMLCRVFCSEGTAILAFPMLVRSRKDKR